MSKRTINSFLFFKAGTNGKWENLEKKWYNKVIEETCGLMI